MIEYVHVHEGDANDEDAVQVQIEADQCRVNFYTTLFMHYWMVLNEICPE